MKQFSPNDSDEAIGKRVEYLRIYHGMRKTELADRLNMLDYLFAGHTEGLTPENSGLPPLNLDASEWEVFSEFMAAYALISPIERYDDLIYDLMRHTLSHYTKLIHANLIEK